MQAGAGIVADSDPDDENLECRNKAAALLAAVPGSPPHAPARRLAIPHEVAGGSVPAGRRSDAGIVRRAHGA